MSELDIKKVVDSTMQKVSTPMMVMFILFLYFGLSRSLSFRIYKKMAIFITNVYMKQETLALH